MRIFSYIFFYIIILFCISCENGKKLTNTQATKVATATEIAVPTKEVVTPTEATAALPQCEDSLSAIKSDPNCNQWINQIPWLFKARTRDAQVRIDQSGKVTWLSGVWIDGTWENGVWEFGSWLGGVWKNGTWEYGVWYDGTWKNGVWKNGTWENGVWVSGTWLGGIWKGDPAKHPDPAQRQ